MATELEELLVQLKADNEQFKAEMKASRAEFSSAMDGMTKAVDEFSKKSGQGFKISTLAIGNFVGGLGVAAVKKGLETMKDAVVEFAKAVLVDGVGAAKEEELSLRRLGTAFAMAGQEAESNVSKFQAFTDSIQETTGFEGDAILKTGALIQTMARLDQEGLQKATTAAMGLSQAMGIDLETATQAVGKAATGQVAALSKMGIKIQETGDKAFDAANALAILSQRFPVDKVMDYAAAQAQLENSFGDTLKELGKMITQNPVVVSTFQAITKEVLGFAKVIQANAAVIKEWVAEGVLIAVKAAGYLTIGLGAVVKTADILWQSFMTGAQVIYDLAEAAVALQHGNLKAAGEAFGSTADRANKLFNTATDGKLPLQEVVDSLSNVHDATQMAFDTAKAENFNSTLKGSAAATQEVADAMTAADEAAGKFGQDLAKKGVDPSQEFADRSEALAAAREADLITEQEYFTAKNEMNLAQDEAERAALDSALATGRLSNTQYMDALFQLEQQQANRQLALDAQVHKTKEANLKNSLGIIAGLSQASSSELVAIGKAAGTAQAIIDGQVAIQKAWAVGGPLGGVLAAGVAAATAVQIAKIQGIALAGGIDSVPGVGSGDTVPAMLTPGERVVPKNTNQDLKAFLENQNESRAPVVNATFNISGIIDADGQKIVRAINDALASGGLRILQT